MLDLLLMCELSILGRIHRNIAEHVDVIAKVTYCNMCTCSGNGTQEQAVQDLLCLVDLYLVYLI